MTSQALFHLGTAARAVGVDSKVLSKWISRAMTIRAAAMKKHAEAGGQPKEFEPKSPEEAGYWIFDDDGRGGVDSPGKGYTRVLSLDAVVQIGIAAELHRLGFPVGEAFRAAMVFAFSSSGSARWVKSKYDPVRDEEFQRLPGQLFAKGETWLVTAPGTDSRVINRHVKDGDTVTENVLVDAFGPIGPGDAPRSFAVVNISTLYRDITARLEAMTRGGA